MTPKVYLNGTLIDYDAATVHISCPALLHGVGLFETLRAYDGHPFRLNPHIDRLKASAEKLNMPIGELIEQIPDAVTEVLRVNEHSNRQLIPEFNIAGIKAIYVYIQHLHYNDQPYHCRSPESL